jgi:predicted cupin superfamily sugar epimerase
VVAPGFDYKDFTCIEVQALIDKFPQHKEAILKV